MIRLRGSRVWRSVRVRVSLAAVELLALPVELLSFAPPDAGPRDHFGGSIRAV